MVGGVSDFRRIWFEEGMVGGGNCRRRVWVEECMVGRVSD